MNKTFLLVLTAALAGGCVPPPARPVLTARPTPALIPATVSATPVAATRPAEPVGGRIVEIITRPVVVRQPTTGRATVVDPAGDAAVSTADVPTPRLTLDDFKRVDAAVSCAPLTRLLAMKLNNIPYQRFAGYGALDFTPNLPEGTNPDAMTNDVIGREASGSAGAIRQLIKKDVDLVIASRLPTDAELAAAAAAKVHIRSDLVATDALVFTVNAANPLTGLSQSQLLGIFSGQAKVWKDLGAASLPPSDKIADQPITIAYRASGTGAEELMSQLLLGGKKVPELPVSKALSTNKLVLDASLEDPETIGFSVFAYATNMRRDGRVKVLAVDGVLPEPARVASGEYPLTTPIYVLTRGDLTSDTDLFKLRTWLGAMNGQRALAEAGYMPISSEAWTSVRLMGK